MYICITKFITMDEMFFDYELYTAEQMLLADQLYKDFMESELLNKLN